MHSRRNGYRIAVPMVLSWLVALPALAADVPSSGAITFSSGSLEGTFSKRLGPGKFGLSSAPTRQCYAVCNRK